MATLYIEDRPTTFDDMVGNEAAINAFKKAIEKKKHSHVYLLTGPAGTGKTTIARIGAEMLGARELDVREINSANNRGIDTAREIMQQARLMPSDSESEAIAYIIDEVHKTTADWQNAMLKILEDTPEHVYFFLCTTDPQKLIKAVKSRCTEIKTAALSVEQLQLVLKRVNKLEGLKIDKEILEEIADKAEGSSRNALVMLEQVASAESENDIKAILDSRGSDDDPDTILLCRALLDSKNGWREISAVLRKLKDAGKLDDSESIRYMVLGYMNSVLIGGKMNQRAVLVMEAFSENTYNTGKFGITLACLNAIS